MHARGERRRGVVQYMSTKEGEASSTNPKNTKQMTSNTQGNAIYLIKNNGTERKKTRKGGKTEINLK